MSGTITRKPETRYPKLEPLAKTVERVIDNIGKRTGRPEYVTGLEVLDVGIFGLHPSQLTTVAARPGVGKTSLVCQVGMNLARAGKSVAFLSLEMTKETILERIFAIEYGVPGMDLIMGNVSDSTARKFANFRREAETLPLKIIDDYCHTENELYTLFDHLNFRPEILILDHIQHIRAIDRKSNWECLTEYLRYLKEIAMKHKIAVVCLSQINRSGEDAPTLANLKGTGAIEEMSDHVLLMHSLKEPLGNGSNFKIQVAKNRFGPVGTFELYFNGSIYKFFNNKYESEIAA